MIWPIFGYTVPSFPGSKFIPPILGTVVFVYGGLVFIRWAIFLLQIVPAILLLANRYVPLALTILGAVIVNLCFHIFMAPAGLPLALVVTALWFLTAWRLPSAFLASFSVRSGGST